MRELPVRVTFATRLVSVMVCLATAGCVVGRDSAITPDAWILTEGPRGGFERCPVKLGGKSTILGIPYRIGTTLEPMSGVFSSGLADGMSGSPLVDDDGRPIGALARVLSGANSRAFAWLETSDLEEAMARRARGAPEPHPGPTIPPLEESSVRPGTSIQAASLWGDLCVVASGVVAARKERDVVIYAHLLRGQGRCTYALMRAPVCGVVRTHGEFMKICGSGPIVGSVDYDGSFGCVGTLGETPPSVEFRIRVSNGSRAQDLTVYVARDPLRASELLQILADEVANTEPFFPHLGRMRMTTEVDGQIRGPASFALEGVTPAQILLRNWQETAISDGVFTVSRVASVVEFPGSESAE